MIRRQNRLRREFLYKKSIETKEKLISEKKQRLKEALERISQILCLSLSHLQMAELFLPTCARKQKSSKRHFIWTNRTKQVPPLLPKNCPHHN
jgi:hypothetical protein